MTMLVIALTTVGPRFEPVNYLVHVIQMVNGNLPLYNAR